MYVIASPCISLAATPACQSRASLRSCYADWAAYPIWVFPPRISIPFPPASSCSPINRCILRRRHAASVDLLTSSRQRRIGLISCHPSVEASACRRWRGTYRAPRLARENLRGSSDILQSLSGKTAHCITRKCQQKTRSPGLSSLGVGSKAHDDPFAGHQSCRRSGQHIPPSRRKTSSATSSFAPPSSFSPALPCSRTQSPRSLLDSTLLQNVEIFTVSMFKF